MGFANFFGHALKHAGGVLRKVGHVGGEVLRRVGAPIGNALKPLASAVSGLLPRHPVTDFAHAAVQKGLDYVGSGRAADDFQQLAPLGDRMASMGRKFHAD